MSQIIIDPEFKALIPPLLPAEREQLEANILADGCLDSLKLWNGTLLDGHNRYEICTAHGLDFRTEEIPLESREDAVIWICKNQTGRRNITDEQKTYLLGKQYEATKKLHGGNRGNRYTELARDHNGPLLKPRTAEKVASDMGVGQTTVKRAEKFAKGLDAIGESAPELKQEILSGKTSATKKDVSAIATIPEPERPAAIEKIKNGEKVTKPPITVSSGPVTVDLNAVVRTMKNDFDEFIESMDNFLDVHRDLIDKDPQQVISVFSDYINTLNEMKEGLK